MATVEFAFFASTIRTLLRQIIEARRDIEVLQRMITRSVPQAVAINDEVRAEVESEIAPTFKAIEETPDDKIVEFLRNYTGTIQ